MQSNIQVSKNLLGRFKSFQYKCEIALTSQNFRSIFENCIYLVSKLKSESKTLRNIKGLDRFNFADELAVDHQLFSYAVSYHDGNNIQQKESFYLITPFESFSGSDVLHKIEAVAGNELGLEIDSPLQRSELSLDSFQLGMDFYGTTSFGNWFLKTPVVIESFYLKATGDGKLELYLMSENSPDKMELPAQIAELFASIKNLLNVDLFADIKTQFQNKN